MTYPKAIVVLGAGVMQTPLIFAVKKYGYAVIACDINANAVGRVHCDEFWNINLSNTNAIIKKILTTSFSVHAVLTVATDFSYAVAKIADECKLPGLSLKAAKNFVFKHNMRKVLQNAGVFVPQFKILYEDTIKTKKYVDIACSLGYPVVIKPLHNMGARGVQKVYSNIQIHEAIRNALMYSKKNMLIMESSLEGPELSVDALLYNNNLYILGIADRHISFSPYCVELGHSMPSSLPKSMIEISCQEIKKATVALGMKEGICKADVIFHKDKPYIGELAARLSGGYMSGWTSAYYCRKNITHLAVSIALKKRIPITIIEKIHKQAFSTKIADTKNTDIVANTGERAVIGLPGKIIAIRTNTYINRCLKESNTFPQNYFYTYSHAHDYYPLGKHGNKGKVFAIYLHKKVGDISCFPKNNTQKIASILIKAKNLSDMNYIAAHTISDIFIDIKINQEANDFLYSLQSKHQLSSWRCFPLDANTIAQILENNGETLSIKNKQNMLQFLYTIVQKKVYELTVTNKEYFISYAKQCFGTWTFCSLYDALQIAIKRKFLHINYTDHNNISKEAYVFQQCIWRSFLRAGWQGLYYTRKLIQQCPQEFFNYV